MQKTIFKKQTNMKKICLLFIGLVSFLACDNEPLDTSIIIENPTPTPPDTNPGTDSDDLTLVLYELDTDLFISFFGIPLQTVTNTDLNIENDKIISGTNAISVEGSPFVTENQVITRNEMGQVISDVSVNASGVVTNEYIITYENNLISTITYNYFEDDTDDFSYSYTYEGNTITRQEEGTNISTVFTLDNSGRIIQKESFDGEFSVQNEIVSYDADGNIAESTISGEFTQTSSFTFDSNPNPLKIIYDDNYLLNFLADEYSDEIGQPIAQFNSTNNWTGATFNGESFSFDLTYNSVGRIESRNIAFNLGEDFSVSIDERFTYDN
jgi:hypothetical protein